MTPAEWNASAEPQTLLFWLHEQGKLSERKARLFAVAVCRRVWQLLPHQAYRDAVEVAEKYADETATDTELAFVQANVPELKGPINQAYYVGWAAIAVISDTQSSYNVNDTIRDMWRESSYAAAMTTSICIGLAVGTSQNAEWKSQADLLRCIVNPFRSGPPLKASADCVSLAQSIYELRSFDRLPELALRLEEERCNDAELLGHLRAAGPHARACWALDEVLGKD